MGNSCWVAILQTVGIFILRRYDVFYRTVPVINFDHLGYRFTQVVPKILSNLQQKLLKKSWLK